MKPCPECCADVPDKAEVCPACCSRIVGQQCSQCAELSKNGALKCRYCGHDFAREKKMVAVSAFSTKAALLPTILFHHRLLPREIHLSTEKIIIKSWGWMGLSHTDEDIPWEKVAGYHYHSGWFWDSIEIQTRGQNANSINCLPKTAGQRIKQTLEKMKA